MTSPPKMARKWMPEEDQRLRNILASIEVGTDINWHHVASHIPGRNNKECRKRWIYALMPTLKKGPWNDKEDERLVEGVRLHGMKWPLVSQAVGTRQPDQCSRRWHESLNPEINHGRWSLFEDQLLREAVQTYGRRWTEIVERYFPSRTPIAAKKRYAQVYQSKAKQPKSDSEPESSGTNTSQRPSEGNSQNTIFKREDSEPSSQLLWHVPDHSQQSQQTAFSSAHTRHHQAAPILENLSPRYISESALSSPSLPLAHQYPTSLDLSSPTLHRIPFSTPNTPHYSPTYSRDGSLGGTSLTEYPTAASVSSENHMWLPAESQSAYSGSPFLFHDTGYFDPHPSYSGPGASHLHGHGPGHAHSHSHGLGHHHVNHQLHGSISSENMVTRN